MKRSSLMSLRALLACAAVIGLAACGSSSSSSSSGGGGSAAASGPNFTVPAAWNTALKGITGFPSLTAPATVPELTMRVAKYTATPTKLLINTPMTKKASPGKTMALLVCGVPVCTNFGNAVAQAAQLLGWKIIRIPLGVAPADFVAAYTQAIQDHPDVVVGSGLARDLFNKQLDQLQAMNIPVIEWSSPQTPVPGHTWTPVSQPIYEASGQMIAEDIALQSHLDAQVVSFSVPQYGLIELQAKVLKTYLPEICPKCTVDQQELSVTSIGSAGPSVTAYLEAHPDVKYVVMGFSDLATGVAQAIKSAGITGVKIYSKDTDTPTVHNIIAGTEYATVPLPIGQTGWQIVDLAQRIFNGQSTADTSLQPVQIVKQPALTKLGANSPVIGAVPNYQALYKKLWLLG